MEWGPRHDRLLTFAYRCVGGCVADRPLASEVTVDLVAALLDHPDLDDDRSRSKVVAELAAALTPYADPWTIHDAVRHAAWRDLVGRPGFDPHSLVDAVRGFTRHLSVPA